MTQLPQRIKARKDSTGMSNFVRTILKQVGLFAGLLYFGGWIYLDRYYSQFDIDLGLLDLSWYDVIIHSAALLKSGVSLLVNSPAVLAVFVLPFLFWAAGHYLPRYATTWNLAGVLNVAFYFPLVAVITGILIFLLAAQYVGATQARQDWVAAREPIIITFKEDKCGTDRYLKDANEKWQLRLLRAAPKWYFVFKPSPEQTPEKSLPIRVFHIPISCIASIQRMISSH